MKSFSLFYRWSLMALGVAAGACGGTSSSRMGTQLPEVGALVVVPQEPVSPVCLGAADCPRGMVCRGDACIAECGADQGCPEPLVCCEGACVDLRYDRGNCGECGRRCAGEYRGCRDAACVLVDPCGATASSSGSRYWSGEGGCVDNASNNFSASENPSGNWSYGWAAERGGEFLICTTPWRDTRYGSDLWTNYGAGGQAHLYHNSSGETQHPAGSTTVEANWLILHPGSEGQKSVLRWTAPAPGHYGADVFFQGASGYWGYPVSTVDAAVLKGKTVLFDGYINVAGGGNTASYTGFVDLEAGESLDIEIGFGNGSWGYDGTRVEATISQ